MKAAEFCLRAAELVSGDRAKQHGEMRQNCDNIAALWNAYLAIRNEPAAPLSAVDVAHLMALLKVARTQLGALNIEDWTDGVGYLSMAGQMAVAEAPHIEPTGTN